MSIHLCARAFHVLLHEYKKIKIKRPIIFDVLNVFLGARVHLVVSTKNLGPTQVFWVHLGRHKTLKLKYLLSGKEIKEIRYGM